MLVSLMHIYVYVAIIHINMHIAAPGAVFSRNFQSQEHSNRPSVLACHTSTASGETDIKTLNSFPRFQLSQRASAGLTCGQSAQMRDKAVA